MEIRLCCVNENVVCVIYSITGQNKCRLLEMGFIRGAEIKIIRKSVMNGPLEIQIRNFKIALRKEEAANILVNLK